MHGRLHHKGRYHVYSWYLIAKLPIDKAEIGIIFAPVAGESRWLSERALKEGSLPQSEATLQDERETGG
jgi:hypothetical protein